MNMQLPLVERHSLIKGELNENLQKKRSLELEISKQFQELKKLETSLERHAHMKAREGVSCK